MQDVADVQQFKKINYFEALDYAIDKNKELILNSIKNAGRCDAEDSFDIWDAVAAVELNGRCRGLTRLTCYCNDCNGESCLIKYLKYLLIMFKKWKWTM